MNRELLNGGIKCSLIESFKGEVFVIRPGFKKSFKDIWEAQKFIENSGWEVSIDFIKGSPLARKITE
jgi:hypothetical protein